VACGGGKFNKLADGKDYLMNPMGRIQIVLVLLLCVCGVTSCLTSGATGIYPAPVWLPEIEKVKVPSGSFIDGETAEFEVEWTGGRSPFTVFWDFGKGGSPQEIESAAAGQSHAVSTKFVNEGTEEVTYTGSVRVVDSTNNAVTGSFTYTVGPAPEPEPPPVEEPPVEQPPVDEEEPPVDEEEPPVDEEEPPVDEEEPPVDEEEPPVDDDPPVVVDPPPPPI
jgi:hypothetical protein